MDKRVIPFSPPDMSEDEINEVADTLRNGWITTGPKVKEFERQIAKYVGVNKAVCLNSQTACAEMALRVLGVGEGDEVIVPAYTYTASASVVCHVGAKLVLVDVKKDSLEMDYDAFEKAIVENDVKMFILCNPYNPIGKVWKEDELKQIGEICKKHDVLVIVDEIHEDFVYGDHVHIPFYNVDESYKEFSVVLTAPSKTFNLAGLQTSNIIIANEKLRKVYQETMNRYGVNEPNFLGIIACMTAYNECELWVDEMLEYVYDNFTYFDEFLKENLPHIHLVKPEGLYLGWVDFRECGLNKDELEKTMLEKAGLWLDEGYIFGTGGEGFERFNLAIPRSVLEDACQRLLKAFGK